MLIRDDHMEDLADIIDIYNAAIPGRLAPADLERFGSLRRAWFAEYSFALRPLWILNDGGTIRAWLSFQSF
jgi:L-amino acid N-acyltransferase YncA